MLLLLAQVLGVLGMASLLLSMRVAYLAGPQLKAYLKRQAPSVDVPAFDFDDLRGTNRLHSLLWQVRIPPDRPRLRRMVLAHRALFAAAPLMMFASLMLTVLN